MRNKTWKYLVVTSAIFVLSACGGGTKKQVNEDVSMDNVNGVCDGLKTLQLDEVKVTWIQDNAKERLMERTLFADADDSLIESLKLEGGIPSSMSAFLVESESCLIRAWEHQIAVCYRAWLLWELPLPILNICILPISMAITSVE